MAHMQIDFPSSLPLRTIGYKRPRSPASPSPLGRPSKRVSLAPGPNGRTHSPLLDHVIQQDQQASPNATLQPLPVLHERRASSDDWVSRTGGLKLESPLFGLEHEHAHTVPLPKPGKWSCEHSTDVSEISDAHELMNTDADDGPQATMDPWLFPPIAEQPVTPQPHTTRTPFSSPLPQSSHSLGSSVQPPDIHIQPATPSELRPHHLINQSSPMSISPSRSGTWSPSSSTKKPRVTMGPRPDCEKCRQGVKGHWMHIE